MDEATRIERERCLRIVEVHFPNMDGTTIGGLILSRIANMIRNGETNPKPIGPLEEGEGD